MAIDQTPSTSLPDKPQVSAIENEFPAYRAISPMAVFSLVLGLGSVFCFASPWFLVVVAGSVLTGWMSIRKIQRLPEVLTGANYARVGMGLGLLFGLVSVTYTVLTDFNVNRDASEFARRYVEVIKNKPMSEALWFEQQPAFRITKTPDEIADDLKKSKSKMSPDPYGEKTADIQKMKDRLKGQGESIKFSKIETKVIDGLSIYANALIELDGPGSKDFPEKEQFALVQLFRGPDGGRNDWIVQSVKFPYTPASTVAEVEKKGDDGHGH